jgi:hypothetical protein
LLVRVGCLWEGCSASANGTLSFRRSRRALAMRRATARVAIGRERRLELRLSKRIRSAMRRAVARRRGIVANVNVAVRYDSGMTHAVYRKLRLRR